VGIDGNKILKGIFKLQTVMLCTVYYCSGSDEGQIMDYYHSVSILEGSIKDEEFLDQLRDCQLIKEDCFIEAVFKRIRNNEFKNCPLLSSSHPSVTACDKQPEYGA
jgi:hypothetical protein